MGDIVYPVTFNGTDLNTVSGLTVLKTTPYEPAKRDVSMSQLARSNKGKVNSANYNERLITVTISIRRNTRRQVEASLDDLMAILQPIDKALIFNQGATTRRYTATLQDTVVSDENVGGSFLQMDLIFTCSDKYGYDIAAKLLLQITGFTSASRSDRLTFTGSAEWQCPTFNLTFTTVAGTGTRRVSIGNDNTGQLMSITRTWANGDNLVIDTLNKTVKVNGIDVDFDGAIPEFNVGFGFWSYGDTFTSRTFSGQITHTPRYV